MDSRKSLGDTRLDTLYGCTQCGKCTGICPGSEVDPSYNPRKNIYLASLANDGHKTGLEEELLKKIDPSGCFQCYWLSFK